MKNNYYSNYQRYLKNGNRVASFGIEKRGVLEIFLLYCSSKDCFSKQTAKTLYKYYLENGEEKMKNLFPEYHPMILLIPINEKDSASWTFQNYIKENFYKKKERVRYYVEEYLINKNSEIVKRVAKFNKFIQW